MRTLLIACGNPLRGDDGVAAHALQLLPPRADVERRSVHQLAPELASDVAGCEVVLFVDADVAASEVHIVAVDEVDTATPALTHDASPSAVVALAHALFGWRGAAYVCALPVDHLDAGAPLSARARRSARIAARMLGRFLATLG